MQRLLSVMVLGFLCVSCENSMHSVDSQQQTSRDALGLSGPVRVVSVFESHLVKEDGRWQPGEETPVSVDRFDRRGNRTEYTSYNTAGAVQESRLVSYDESGHAGEERHLISDEILADGVLQKRIVSRYNDRGEKVEAQSFTATDVLIDRTVFAYDANGNAVTTHTYTPAGELQHRTASTYDSQGNLAEKHDYYAAGRLKRKAVYHRDYRGALITLITYDYAADSTLAGRIDVHYNNRGNPHEVVAYGSNGKSQHKEMFTYRYDAFGNWVTQTAKRQVVTKNAAYFEPTRILMRVFEYYERE